MQWSAYLARRGSINQGRRLEVCFAQVLEMMARYMGSKDVTLKDFMPHEEFVQREEAPVATFNQFLSALQSTARG